MGDLPYESLVGVSSGLALGFVSALLVGLVTVVSGVVRKRAVSIAVGAVLVIFLTLVAGWSAGLFSVGTTSQVTRIATLSIVAGLLGVVATNQGNQIATELPLHRTLPMVRGQALSPTAVDAVDAIGQVTIRPIGAIGEFDSYPPLSPPVRRAIESETWRFPADLQLAELERRLELRLRTAYGVTQVDVSIDGRGLATIAAAPPAKGVATGLSPGTRAVTVSGILPTGIEPGDGVSIWATSSEISGEVLAIAETDIDSRTDWLTVAVPTAQVGELLDVDTPRIAIRPSGEHREFEAIALLERAGRPVLEVDHPEDEPFEPDETLAIAVDGRWRFDGFDTVTDRVDRSFVASSSGTLHDRSSANSDGSRVKEVTDR